MARVSPESKRMGGVRFLDAKDPGKDPEGGDQKSSGSVEILPEMARPDDGGGCTGFENKAEASFRTPQVSLGGAQIDRI